MLFFTDPSTIDTELCARTLDCPHLGCVGTLPYVSGLGETPAVADLPL